MGKRKKEEVEYCKNVLKPLFESMSHIYSLHYRHGNTEFGKDFTFYYYNPLNQRINVGIQAKWGDIRGSSTSIVTKLYNQIRVAFSVPYNDKPDREKLYLNEIYLICSGKYTRNAIEIIEEMFVEKRYNIHYLDGSDIKALRAINSQDRSKRVW